MPPFSIGLRPAANYPGQIKKLRAVLGLTQQVLAEKLGVSFATVNRWENGQTRPSQLSWQKLRHLQIIDAEEALPSSNNSEPPSPIKLDLTAPPEIVKVLAEGERLSRRRPLKS